jgi:acetate---CoA ligase (ADP-forming) subunit beta
MPAHKIIQRAQAAGETALSEFDSKQLLAHYGVQVCREVLASDVESVCGAAAEIGYPVVLKACASGLTHKTEGGLVIVGVMSEEDTIAAAEQLFEMMPAGGQVLVQEMIQGRRELMLGMKRDPQYGPCISFGLGGVFAEALNDVALCLAPVSTVEAAGLLDGIRAKAVLGPYRGMPSVDRDALIEAIIGLSRIATEHSEIAEIDINPMIIDGDRPIAVDALVVLAT